MTSDLHHLVKKMWRCSKYPSLYKRQRNYKTRRALGAHVPPTARSK